MGPLPPDRPPTGPSDPGDDDLPPDPFAGADPFPEGTPDSDPAGGTDPLGASPFGAGMLGGLLGDLTRQLAAQGPIAWDAARHSAIFGATDGIPEANVDPLERVRLEELVAIAAPYVADATGLPVGGISVLPVTRAQWAVRFLDEHRPLLERLAGALHPGTGAADNDTDPEAAMLAGLLRMMGPALLGLQSGALAGHLAKRCLGSYDLPLPRPAAELLIIPANVRAFATDWSLPIDSVRMRLLLGELAHHAVLAVPHVHTAIDELLNRYASAYRVDPEAVAERFGTIDPTDPRGFEQVLSDPAALLGVVTSPEQNELRIRIDTLVAAIVGYADHIVATTSARLLGGQGQLGEALRRRRIEVGGADQMAERLLGLTIDRQLFERGGAFISGILERAGDEGLTQLWSDSIHLPTPAELDAPGLWLARIEL